MNIQIQKTDYERPTPSTFIGSELSWHYCAANTERLAARLDKDGRLLLFGEAGAFRAEAQLDFQQQTLKLGAIRLDPLHNDATTLLAALLDAVFQRFPDVPTILVPLADVLAPVSALALRESDGLAVIERHVLRQLPLLWRKQAVYTSYPALRSSLGPAERLPLLRPPRPSGVFYERWIPELNKTVSLRPIDRRTDLDMFYAWMNQGRVSFFWELAQSREALETYLCEQESDAHIFGVIASFDHEPAGYFEFYWAREDRLGPHYESEDFDRGWHGLIGNPRHLGRPKTLALFRSVTHYLFLDEPRTRRIVGEPRASHQKMLSYCADVAYDKVKEFDFPHKRAALVCCERERFFREVPL
ncbi:GNAT family N-acetyltransferase [Ochrobactrum chromiisoli]|uniref:GNAT family N-acetyltransferase n=1 Tax=Ochrobactrum chromiisoli TaxID=2993941 RepID=A0ABT3QTJ4_9HYPH|nr:GNAT family N-acetyltransferase [Ochrobactrum chromiisoli]MCX2698825.1 GNAT family N-acetyltransferase [Ochrobactrum chromiisoli]